MHTHSNGAKGLFLASDGKVYPDTLICSGILPAHLDGKPCPYAQNARLPDPQPLDVEAVGYNIDKGKPGDLCPPCAKQNLSSLAHWQGHGGQNFPEELLPLRLFKCRQWLWFVVPGLLETDPTYITEGIEK